MRKVNVLLILCFALVFASIAGGQSNPGANNAELNGNYAFTFRGFSGNLATSSIFGAVGRFTADGAGNLTNGELDTNAVGTRAAAQSFTGTYSIGADNTRVENLKISRGSAELRFTMMAHRNDPVSRFGASRGPGN